MRFVLLVSIILSIHGSIGSANNQEPFCVGPEMEIDDRLDYVYPYPLEDGKVRMKFIFVGFPGTGLDHTLTHEDHGRYVDYMRDYLSLQTYGKLTLHEDSSVLLPPGEVLDEQNDSVAWIADLYPSDYLASQPNPWPYLDANPELANWYNSQDGSRIQAEILHKIWKAYDGHTNPFPAPVAGEPGWELAIGFLLQPDVQGFPSPMIYWRPWIVVDAETVLASTNGFFENVHRNGNRFAGCAQIGLARDTVWQQPDRKAVFFYTLHEWAHTLDIWDGPPQENSSLPNLARYKWGNLNLTTQTLPATFADSDTVYGTFHGFPPIGDHWLAFLPWNTPPGETSSVKNVTGQSLYRERIYDVTTGGQLYRIDVGKYSPTRHEYFLLAYHGGNGLDGVVHNPSNPRPTILSQGLAIWHCIGPSRRDVEYVDLEVATGLHRYDAVVPGGPLSDWDEPWNVEGLAEDRESGYDGYDYWTGRNTDEWQLFTGSRGDFFRIDIEETDPDYEHLHTNRCIIV